MVIDWKFRLGENSHSPLLLATTAAVSWLFPSLETALGPLANIYNDLRGTASRLTAVHGHFGFDGFLLATDAGVWLASTSHDSGRGFRMVIIVDYPAKSEYRGALTDLSLGICGLIAKELKWGNMIHQVDSVTLLHHGS
ncbi:hypothetical protein C8J56DRAFT_893169 [Mycena floridula]|nr:hypothetical protein C8J56DRAFT_893169 [Mycena floridula]